MDISDERLELDNKKNKLVLSAVYSEHRKRFNLIPENIVTSFYRPKLKIRLVDIWIWRKLCTLL